MSICVSLAILAIVWSLVDTQALWSVLAQTSTGRLALALILLSALVFLSGIRLILLARVGGYGLSVGQGLRATFVANTLNMVLPSKLGDVLKATVIAQSGTGQLRHAFALAVWEKLADLTTLFVTASITALVIGNSPLLTGVLVLGSGLGVTLLLVPRCLTIPMRSAGGSALGFAPAWERLLGQLKSRPTGLIGVLALSGVIWLGHLVQIALMIRALGVDGDAAFWGDVIAMMPVVIVAGLLPLTFAGIGTRDAAIVALLGPMIGGAAAAATGVLFWLRYLVPGLIGLPFMSGYGAGLRRHLEAAQKENANGGD